MEELYALGYWVRDGSFNVKKSGSEAEMKELLKKQKSLKKHIWEVKRID